MRICDEDGLDMVLAKKTSALRLTEQPWEWHCPAGHMVKASGEELPDRRDPRLSRP